MTEHLTDVKIPEGVAIIVPEQPAIVTPVTADVGASLQADRDRVNVRLQELREQARLGGNTRADQQLIAAQEAKLKRLESGVKAPIVENNAGLQQGIGHRVLSVLKALVGKP